MSSQGAALILEVKWSRRGGQRVFSITHLSDTLAAEFMYLRVRPIQGWLV